MENSDKFWIYNPKLLFSSSDLFPLNNMTFNQKINCLTRLVFVTFVIMLLFNFSYCFHFLIISFVSIIILYYIKKYMKNKETFIYEENTQPLEKSVDLKKLTTTKNVILNGQPYIKTFIETSQNIPFCNDDVTIDPISEYSISMNQKLTGNTPNPKTLINPVVFPPSHDLEYWRDNDLIVHSALNKKSLQEDMYLSGYAESVCCDIGNGNPATVYSIPEQRENYSNGRQIVAPKLTQDQIYVPTMNRNERVTNLPYHEQRENYDMEEPTENQPGWMNISCGYNPEQINVGLPSNMATGNCQRDPRMKQYNENLFTQIVTPGVYTRSQINEPINSNIGISFQQQFEPTTYEINENQIMYTQHDPRIMKNIPDAPYEYPDKATYDNVYDPRFSGYGTSYRSYLEPVTGQTRFMYDDINAIRMPNYIVRSKIDHLPYADHYGPIEEGSEMGNINTPNIRSMVQDSWLENSLQFRNDLSERLMRKTNAEAWQRKQAPIHTNQSIAGRNRG